jgi:hypothetical protein
MRRCVASILHMLFLLIVIEPNRGKVVRFLESDGKTECQKGVNAQRETDGILSRQIKRRSAIGRSRINRSSHVSLKEYAQFTEQYDR